MAQVYSGLAPGSADRTGFPVVCRALLELDLLLHPEAGLSRPDAPEAGPFGSEAGPSGLEAGERHGTFWAASESGPAAGKLSQIKSEACLLLEAARGRALDAACAVLPPPASTQTPCWTPMPVCWTLARVCWARTHVCGRLLRES